MVSLLCHTLRVACFTQGISPIPMYVIYPGAEDMLAATGSTCFQKFFNLLNLIVALVSTAINPSYSVCFGKEPKTYLPSQVPYPSIGSITIVNISHLKRRHQLVINAPYKSL